MDTSLDKEARRLLIRFGHRALALTADRAREMAERGDWRAQDRFLLMLTRLEHLAGVA